MTTAYDGDELACLRATIVGLRRLSDEEVQSATASVRQGSCPGHLAAFWSLAAKDGEIEFDSQLFNKLSLDPLLSSYSFYGLFPATYRRIYLNGERPEIVYDGRTRGRVAILRFGDRDGIVIKPLQSDRENAIAQLAGDMLVGPDQLPRWTVSCRKNG